MQPPPQRHEVHKDNPKRVGPRYHISAAAPIHHLSAMKYAHTLLVYGPRSLIIATRSSLSTSRSTTAFTECVVPTEMCETCARSIRDSTKTRSMTVLMPFVTLEVVGILDLAKTPFDGDWRSVLSRTTASVFVPPMSQPMRYIMHTRQQGNSQRSRSLQLTNNLST